MPGKFEAFLERGRLGMIITSLLIAIFTILGNTLVLIATWKEKSLHQPNKYFVACLAVADLLVGVFVAPLKVYQYGIHRYGSMPIHLCRFMVWTDTFALTASIYTLTIISFDRYLKISKPLLYKSRMTTSRSVKIIFFIVLIAISFATYSATPNSGSRGILETGVGRCTADNDLNEHIVFYLFLSISAFFLPFIIILIMYALIFHIAHKRNKMLANSELGQTINDQNQRTALRRDMKVIRMLLVVVGVFVFCWGPLFIWIWLWNYYPTDWYGGSLSSLYRIYTFITIAYTLPLFNSLCNPLIYACLDQTYSKAFKHLFRQMMRRPDLRRQQPPIELR